MQIMLKDLADSKRLNTSIKQLPAMPNSSRRSTAATNAAIDNMTATILSELFWPALPQDSISVPHEVGLTLDILYMVLVEQASAHEGPEQVQIAWLEKLAEWNQAKELFDDSPCEGTALLGLRAGRRHAEGICYKVPHHQSATEASVATSSGIR